jgi:transcriptional regulator with XRE-family HTH domain
VVEPTNPPPADISSDEEDLRQMLRQSGLTARALAARVGVSESAFSRWIKGYRNPMEVRVEAMARILGKTPEQIRRGFVVSQARYGRPPAPAGEGETSASPALNGHEAG